MEVSSQLHVPVALSRGRRPGKHRKEGWGYTNEENFECPCLDSNPAVSLWLSWLPYDWLLRALSSTSAQISTRWTRAANHRTTNHAHGCVSLVTSSWHCLDSCWCSPQSTRLASGLVTAWLNCCLWNLGVTQAMYGFYVNLGFLAFLQKTS